jgi:hypothetical protein
MVRIAVVGLYNSGSTAMAGMLHRLGVNMGPPFWTTSEEGHARNYYEPNDLAWHLRRWWAEPLLVERIDAPRRIAVFARWMALQESIRPGRVGAKHPLLSLCGPDLVEAWGAETRFIWAWRPLEDSVRQLAARGWFRGHEAGLQRRLWDALHALEASPAGVERIEWTRMRSDPAWGAARLAAAAGLTPDAAQLRHAAALIDAHR